jgi:hypothetical protein
MKYEDTPRPNVEHHYHIRELIERQEKRSDDREYHRNKQKEKEERDELIRDSKPLDVKDFYCRPCDDDFKGQAVKQVEVDWTNPLQNIAFYKSKCFKGHWCIRLVTDRHRDIYFFKSKHVATDRGKHYNDLVQPYQDGYNLLYGKR